MRTQLHAHHMLRADARAAAQRRDLTFTDAVDRYLDSKLEAFKNPKHRPQWRNTFSTYALPDLGALLVSEIKVQDVLRILHPIWSDKTETASRLAVALRRCRHRQLLQAIDPAIIRLAGQAISTSFFRPQPRWPSRIFIQRSGLMTRRAGLRLYENVMGPAVERRRSSP